MPGDRSGAGPSDLQLSRLAVRVGRRLLATGWMLVTAESCTGGWIAKALTDVAGSSGWVAGGFVTYVNDAKMRDLRVPARTLERHGAVSEQTVRAMARGALRRANEARLDDEGPGHDEPGSRGRGGEQVRRWTRRAARVDVAVAVSGIAGPGGGSVAKPVGTVWFCTAVRHGRAVILSSSIKHFRGNREAVRRQAVQYALRQVLLIQ